MIEDVSFGKTIKYFIRKIWNSSKSLIVYCILYVMVSGMMPYIGVVGTAKIVDTLTTTKDGKELVLIVAGIISALLFSNLVRAILNKCINIRTLILEDELRLQLGEKGANLDYKYLENPEVLEQAERAKTGMSFYSGGIRGFIQCTLNIVTSTVTFVSSVVIILQYSLFVVVLLLLLVGCNFLFVRILKKMDVSFWVSMVGINRTYDYFFNMLKDYKNGYDFRMLDAFPMISKQLDSFIGLFDRVSKNYFVKKGKFGVFESILLGVEYISINLIFAWKVLKGLLTIGDFTLCVGAANTFISSLNQMIDQSLEMRKKAQFMSEYIKFIEIKNVKKDGALPMERTDEFELEFQHVSFQYPGTKECVLQDISFTIHSGDRISIVGINGAGKTTIIKLIMRFYEPTDGRILFNGIDIREYDYSSYLRFFSTVFQDFALFSYSLKDNIVGDRSYNEELFFDSLDKSGMREWVENAKHGADTVAYKYFDEDGVNFSGGEAQKLAISRACYKDSPIIILDEPTAALDPISENEIYERFDRLLKNKTAIYISHRMSSCKLCKKIIVLDQGRIIESGSHTELIEKMGKYAQLYNTQAQYYRPAKT